LCMHTIVRDGNRVHLGISTGGPLLERRRRRDVPRRRTRVSAPASCPDPYPEFGQCVHKIERHPDAPGRLYMQNHGGGRPGTAPAVRVRTSACLRSDDHGKSWALDRRRGCRATSASRSSCTRTIPTSSTSCRSSR
jgi:hypothetical protein